MNLLLAYLYKFNIIDYYICKQDINELTIKLKKEYESENDFKIIFIKEKNEILDKLIKKCRMECIKQWNPILYFSIGAAIGILIIFHYYDCYYNYQVQLLLNI